MCGEPDEYDARISDPFGDCEFGVVVEYVRCIALLLFLLLNCLCFEMCGDDGRNRGVEEREKLAA